MEKIFKINPALDVPLYQQLVDAIRVAVKKGELTAGQQLPTVQELTELLGIARGTVKRAYDELEHGGILEKVQGRGTFICYQPADSGSRKERAMAAIDDMLNLLEDMGLSAAEIQIFLNLKLRERAEQEACVKVAVVECNPEALAQMTEQLRHLPGVDLYSYLLESIQQYPYQLSEEFDLIVTTASHAAYLEHVLPAKKRISRVALRPSARCLSQIIKLQPGQRVGIVGYSAKFARLLYETCRIYVEDVLVADPLSSPTEETLEAYLVDKDALLLPKVCEKYFSASVTELLRRFSGGQIECYYEMDEGSVLYLEAKIKRLLEDKTIT